jgi:hypothetical protein
MKSAFAIAAVSFAAIFPAPGATLFFDNISTGTMPASYSNFQWSGFQVVSGLTTFGGYSNAVVSPKNVIGNIDSRFATVSNNPAFAFFTLNSAYLTSAYNDGLHVEAQGFAGGTMVYDNTYIIDTTAPTLIQFNYGNVNAIKFISSGGTLHPGYPDQGVHDFNFAIDNFTFSLPIPEPGAGTMLLLAWATAGLQSFQRKRRQGG